MCLWNKLSEAEERRKEENRIMRRLKRACLASYVSGRGADRPL